MLALAEISHGDYNFHRWTSKLAEKYPVKCCGNIKIGTEG